MYPSAGINAAAVAAAAAARHPVSLHTNASINARRFITPYNSLIIVVISSSKRLHSWEGLIFLSFPLHLF